mmetsp:Transcript_24332/g.52450  ORF Transcript_24332/g.52450 Transcript_24332/m.52450 type:complete len:289 (-) Transcript_24332:4487-5353(-)
MKLMLAVLLFLIIAVAAGIANSSISLRSFGYLKFCLGGAVFGAISGGSILLGRIILVSSRCFTLGCRFTALRYFLRLLSLDLFLLLSCRFTCLLSSQSSSLLRLAGGLGHFLLLPCNCLLVVIEIILDLDVRTCSHSFRNCRPIMTMLVQRFKKQLLLLLPPLLGFMAPLLLFLLVQLLPAFTTLALIQIDNTTIARRFNPLDLAFGLLFLTGIRMGRCGRSSGRICCQCRRRQCQCIGRRLALLLMMIIQGITMLEILLLMSIQNEPIATLSLPTMMFSKLIGLLGI